MPRDITGRWRLVEMVRFGGEVKAGDVILTGSCAKCGHTVVRVLETSERDPSRN